MQQTGVKPPVQVGLQPPPEEEPPEDDVEPELPEEDVELVELQVGSGTPNSGPHFPVN